MTIAAPTSRAQNAPAAPALVGGWTLNRDLSDHPDQADNPNAPPSGRTGRRGGGGFGGGFGGRGGRGGFGRGGSGGGAGDAGNREEMARAAAAVRELNNPPAHLVIVQAESMIVMTGPDGSTLRLSPDNKKIKDDATKIERRTKWDGDKLVSEVTGLGSTKITETYVVTPELHQLRVSSEIDSGRGPKRTITHVYDPGPAR